MTAGIKITTISIQNKLSRVRSPLIVKNQTDSYVSSQIVCSAVFVSLLFHG